MKGYVHLYTGNGKGKTTAAFGLALRAYGAGLNVFIGQFVKGQPYAEIETVRENLPGITVKQFGLNCFIVNAPTENDVRAARQGLEIMKKIVSDGQHDLVIMDEVTIALYYSLFMLDEILEIIHKKPHHVELILTGRYAPDKLIGAADLVTEMKEIKHYYQKGIEARKGIEF